MFGVDLKVIDEKGNRAPPDGETSGELFVRGSTIVSGYFNNPEASAKQIDDEGWFGTGDVAKITPDQWLLIVDRTKDLVKSGGEWISSIDVENAALGCKGLANCAVIGVPHPKWHERPLLVAVKAPGANPTKAEILDVLAAKIAKWQMPDDVVFVDALPMTATGKISKKDLRAKFADHKLAECISHGERLGRGLSRADGMCRPHLTLSLRHNAITTVTRAWRGSTARAVPPQSSHCRREGPIPCMRLRQLRLATPHRRACCRRHGCRHACRLRRQQHPDLRADGQGQVVGGAEPVQAPRRPDPQPGRDGEGLRRPGEERADLRHRGARQGHPGAGEDPAPTC